MTDTIETLRAENARLKDRVLILEKQDREAATHVETQIVMRTDFTGEHPYVGWKGLGQALKEALDERDRLRRVLEAINTE